MTYKKKAKELFKKYSKGKDEFGWPLCEFDSCAKKCAIITCDEIIKVAHSDERANSPLDKEYWIKVREELEKLEV
jgi:hypothetical protein